jgi:MarR family transcriptional regulator, organic hydroperoxide resistance regulator
MKPEETVDFHIKFTWQSIVKMYNDVAVLHEMTMATGYVLLNIDQEKGTPSTALGPQMGMEATSLSRILKALEEKGWIERKKNPKDGRGVLVTLTPLGFEKRGQARAAVIHFNQAVQNHLGAEKMKQFFDSIQEINAFISNQKIFNNVP